MRSEKITLGRIVTAARRRRGLSQRELAKVLHAQLSSRFKTLLRMSDAPQFQTAVDNFEFDFRHLSKIENDRVDVRDRSFDCFMYCFAEWADLSVDWLEVIRQQTEAKPLDLSKAIAIFPPRIYHPK